ncbi:uncharacterized protein LOC117581932 [Drosophila guanche]|uniref:Uncharacterized protein n=1 Tax=Drosophila guanche TaxID=7266 RepID=A0A3B0JC64_DROGU|nr:uncharacterized protein LOC117581932 [Drosophila guanche]SPP79954.1 Hypothetical predicted protein [Drosophila guanche]
MFLDFNGNPIDVTPDNVQGYEYDKHGIMLLTSSETEAYLPPNWHGTIYGTMEMLINYRDNFDTDSDLLKFHALPAYEPELVCCRNVVVEVTVMPAGQSLHSDAEFAVYIVHLFKSVTNPDGTETIEANTNSLLSKEIGTELKFCPHDNHFQMRLMQEGIDVVYLDDKIYRNGSIYAGFQHQRVCSLLRNLEPRCVRSLSGRPLPPILNRICRGST